VVAVGGDAPVAVDFCPDGIPQTHWPDGDVPNGLTTGSWLGRAGRT
jgi:hypothetical protein